MVDMKYISLDTGLLLDLRCGPPSLLGGCHLHKNTLNSKASNWGSEDPKTIECSHVSSENVCLILMLLILVMMMMLLMLMILVMMMMTETCRKRLCLV